VKPGRADYLPRRVAGDEGRQVPDDVKRRQQIPIPGDRSPIDLDAVDAA
jgi:hypothetical protein